MNDHVNHGGDELAPVIPIFGRREEKSPPPENSWVQDANPVASTDDEGWWVDPDVAPVRPLSSAPSASVADDEAGSRRRHPTSAPIPLPSMARKTPPTLVRASDLAKPSGEREAQPIPEGSEKPGPTTADAGSNVGLRDTKRSASAAGSSSAPGARAGARARLRIIENVDDDAPEVSPALQREQAEAALLKKLRGKGLSISEAHSYLRGLSFANDVITDVVDACIARRYLDDAVLAEQIVYAGSTRKGQGRRAIAMALSTRGIDRDVINAALADLPDDDDERALEYARTRAHSLSRLEPEVALRRLMGQLARRGFSGSVAREAAHQALREVTGPRFR